MIPDFPDIHTELLSGEVIFPARAVASVCYQGCSIAWMMSDAAPQRSRWPQMAPDVPTAQARWHQVAPGGATALTSSRWAWMAPDGSALPQMVPDCERWFQMTPDAPDCVEGNMFSSKLDFCSLSNGGLRFAKCGVGLIAPEVQISPDGSR